MRVTCDATRQNPKHERYTREKSVKPVDPVDCAGCTRLHPVDCPLTPSSKSVDWLKKDGGREDLTGFGNLSGLNIARLAPAFAFIGHE